LVKDASVELIGSAYRRSPLTVIAEPHGAPPPQKGPSGRNLFAAGYCNGPAAGSTRSFVAVDV